MAKIVWSPLASGNLKSIFEFLSRKDIEIAGTILVEIIAKVKLLENFPLMGRNVPELPNSCEREIFSNNYRIIYEYNESTDTLEVYTIIHGRQNFFTAYC